MSDNHIFVAKGDITRLRCSAWLLPTDEYLQIGRAWLRNAPLYALDQIESLRRSTEALLGSKRCYAINPWELELGDAPAPIPILTNTGGISSTPLAWFLEGVDEFIDLAMTAVSTQSKLWRERPILALPLVGSGYGGLAGNKGALAREIIRKVELTLKERGYVVDVILMLNNDVAYAAVQANRDATSWDAKLNLALLKEAGDLANRAKRGDLVVFLGAGVSKSAGLPLWNELITRLSTDFGFEPGEVEQLKTLANSDGASAIESRSSPRTFRENIAARFDTTVYGLVHAILASMSIRESVTTNYDSLYETACRAAGHSISTLPYEPTPRAEGWLLKLHGSVECPEDIVITRRDYMRYQNNRAALYGIVQAMLITRHIVFLGFSLTDDNFHILIDEVRRAIDGNSERPRTRKTFGTAIVQRSTPFAKDLWDADIDLVQIVDSGSNDLAAARLTEIFLDYLAFKAFMPIAHFFDKTYHEALTEADSRIKIALDDLIFALGSSLLDDRAIPILRALEAYGFSNGLT